MGVTIRDVARATGVSVATVSLVLNGEGDRLRIAPATQQRVREGARVLGYIADSRARALRRRSAARTVLVAFVARQVPDAFFVELLHALDEAAARVGRDTQFHLIRSGDASSWDIARAAAKSCAGAILVGSPPAADVVGRDAFPVPVVHLGAGDELHYDGVVQVDNVRAGRAVAEHLLALGHRRIAVLGPRRWYAPFVERRAGIDQALRDAGLPAPDAWSDPEPDQETVVRLRRGGITAIACLYDSLALRLLREARLAGMEVPREWSVTGFDDMEWSALLSPALTTVRIPRRRMASAAIERLEALVAAQPATHSFAPIVLHPELVIRESTASPPTHSLVHGALVDHP